MDFDERPAESRHGLRRFSRGIGGGGGGGGQGPARVFLFFLSLSALVSQIKTKDVCAFPLATRG
jgi:hypothetical protein